MTRALLVAVASIAFAAPARAEPFSLEGDYVKIGPTIGGTFGRDRGDGLTLGGVVTVVHSTHDLDWYGARAQLLYDSNGNAARWLVGAEVGEAVFGVIASYAGEQYGGRTDHGFAIHGKLTTGIVGYYFGGLDMLTSKDRYAFDAGIELKIPVWER